MAESNELRDKDTMEIDEAQPKVYLTIETLKVLNEKLKEEAKMKNEIIKCMSRANLNIKSEIIQAEQEIRSSRISMETAKRTSVELKKELLLVKQNKAEIIERAESGEKKYEALWLEAKSRFECLPHVQKLMKAEAKSENLKEQITTLDKQAETLRKEIKAKTEACRIADRERIIQLAHFMVHERPKLIKRINESSKAITRINNDLKTFGTSSVAETKVVMKEKIMDERSKLPKLQLSPFSSDLDDFTNYKPVQKTEENDVTSKFFKNNKDVDGTGDKREIQPVEIENKTAQDNPSKIDLNVEDNVMVSNPKEQNASSFVDAMCSRYLFGHVTQELPESLDMSNSTTDFEDMDFEDTDFSHCIEWHATAFFVPDLSFSGRLPEEDSEPDSD